jgi:uncharacterized protein (TIGR03067 family)
VAQGCAADPDAADDRAGRTAFLGVTSTEPARRLRVFTHKEAEMKCYAVLACAWLTTVAADSPIQSTDALRGSWLGSKGEIDGKATALNTDLTIAGNCFSLRLGKTLYEGNITLGREGQQQTVDLDVTACVPLCRPTASLLDERGSVRDFRETWRGVYVIEEGALKICFGKQDRPKEFTTKAGSNHQLLLFEKPKQRDSAPAKPPANPGP